MPWQQCAICCDEALTEALSEFLASLGALSVTLSDAADQPLYEPPPGTTPLWQAVTVHALFADVNDTTTVDQRLRQRFSQLTPSSIQWETVADRDWERECLDQFKPMRFGCRTWIVPSWERLSEDEDAVSIILDPGLAFGTGSHATTALCLEWLDSETVANRKLLDVGCGSGILAIAACKLGAKHVFATDIDPQALQATRDNALKNNCLDQITASRPEHLKEHDFDIIVANILANPLIEMAEELASLLLPQAKIVLSGILKHQAASVVDRYKQWFILEPITEKEDWVRISGVKRDS